MRRPICFLAAVLFFLAPELRAEVTRLHEEGQGQQTVAHAAESLLVAERAAVAVVLLVGSREDGPRGAERATAAVAAAPPARC